MTLRTTVFAEGDDLRTVIPSEAACRMGVDEGAELVWIADSRGGFRVLPVEPLTRRTLRAHEDAVHEFEDVFRALAQEPDVAADPDPPPR